MHEKVVGDQTTACQIAVTMLGTNTFLSVTNKQHWTGVPVLKISDPNPIFLQPTHYVILRIVMIFTIKI